MSAPSPSPSPQADPVSPGSLLARQFVTLLLLMISLAISFTFFFAQPMPSVTARHSTLLLVWDGMRPDMVTDAITPHLAQLGTEGIIATDHHASLTIPLLPATATNAALVSSATPTATAPAQPSPTATLAATATPATNSLPTTGLTNDLTSLFQVALTQGFRVSYEGAGGTALLQALASPANTAILDDQTTYPASLMPQLQQAQVTPPAQLPAITASHAPDAARTEALTQAFIQVLLPQFKATSAPFLSVIHLGDPTTTAGLTGIGSTAFTDALRVDDAALGELIAALRNVSLLDSVNVIVTSDHGLSDVVAPDATSATEQAYTAPTEAVRTNVAALLTQATALGAKGPLPDLGKYGVSHGTITPQTTVVLTASGGLDALAIPATKAVQQIGRGDAQQGQLIGAQELVNFLQQTPQIGPIFVNDTLAQVSPAHPMGEIDGALPLSVLAPLSAQSPAIVFGFATFARDIGQRGTNVNQLAGSAYADTADLATWGSFGRHDLHTILYTFGPNFKSGGQDLAPTSAADVVPTIASALNLSLPANHQGRVISEILANSSDSGNAPTQQTIASTEHVFAGTTNVFLEVVVTEQYGGETYLQGAYAIRSPSVQPTATLTSQAAMLALQE